MPLWFFSGSLKQLGIVLTQQNMGTWCSDTVIIYYGSFKQISIVATMKNMVTWCSDTVIFFWEFQTTGRSYQQKYLKSTCVQLWSG